MDNERVASAWAEIKSLPPFQTLSRASIEVLAGEATEQSFQMGDLIVLQHDQARALYVLIAGSVEFLMAVEGQEDLVVGGTSEPGALIGWSVFRAPHRYTASVRCREPSRTLRVPRTALDRLLTEDPRAARRILEVVAAALVERLEDARELGSRPRTTESATP